MCNFVSEKIRIFKDGFDPLDADQVKEWEKEQTVEKSADLFEFFFKHRSGEKKENSTPFEDLFRSFSEKQDSKRFRDKKTFEKQFRNSKEWFEQERIKQKQAEEAVRLKEEETLRKQNEELMRQQEIIRRQQQEQLRLQVLIKKQQEEQRKKEEEERLELLRRKQEQQRIQEERERQRMQQSEQYQYSLKHEAYKRYGANNQDDRYRQRDDRNRPHNEYWSQSDGGTRRQDDSIEKSDNFGREEQRRQPVNDYWDFKSANQGQTQQQQSDFYQRNDRTTEGHYRSQNDEFDRYDKSYEQYSEPASDSRKYFRGTDGRYYYKARDGQWKARDSRVQDKNENVRHQKGGRDSYTDKNGKVYVKGSDGNWYMRMDPPTERAGSQQNADFNKNQPQFKQQEQRSPGYSNSDSPTLPRGLYRNDRGQILDRIGNVYERLLDGKYRVALTAAEAKARLKEHLRNHNQADFLRRNPQPTPPSASKQQIFHDTTGNVYIKDNQGNLIKVKPGNQGKKTPEYSTAQEQGYSYKDPNIAWQQKRWHRQSQEGAQNYNQRLYTQQQQHSKYNYHTQNYQNAHANHRQQQRQQQQSYSSRNQNYRPLHEEL